MLFKLSTVVAVALASVALATPASQPVKRFTGGSCGVHVQQILEDEFHYYNHAYFNLKDGTGASLGDDCEATYGPGPGGEQKTATSTCQRGGLPWPLECTFQPNDDFSCTYKVPDAPYTFGTANGCSIGAFDGDERNSDCGFNC